MINNRQAGRRNRGRNNNNNGRSGGQNRGGNDNGNRIDSRARGNAAQLLEKYRNMARDAQLSGDRVNAEYYLQFADHYFRVLADNRARQEEAQGIQRERQPQRPWDPESDGDEFDAVDGNGNSDYDDRSAYAQQGNAQRENGQRDNSQRDNRENANRDNGRDNREQGQRDGNRDRDQNRRDRQPQGQYQPAAQPQAPYQPQPRRDEASEDAPVQAEAAEPRRGRGRPPRQPRVETAEAPMSRDESREDAVLDAPVGEDTARPRRGLRQRRPREDDVERDEPVGLDLAVLPPAIARADNDSEGTEDAAAEAPRKRPRARRPAATEAAE